jgi:hypothetical protein
MLYGEQIASVLEWPLKAIDPGGTDGRYFAIHHRQRTACRHQFL